MVGVYTGNFPGEPIIRHDEAVALDLERS